MTWAHLEQGEGRPLVLVHGIGSSKRSWTPILDRLARGRRAIAFDLPGFGDTPPMDDGRPTPMRFAELLVGQLSEMGVDEFDCCGLSLGGWVALELAKLGAPRSVVALTPAGLWTRQPRLTHYMLGSAYRLAARRSARLAAALNGPAGRTALMFTYYGRPWRMSAEFALESTAVLADSADFERALEGMRQNRFTGGRDITIPLTVAFGSRDLIHPPPFTRRRDELPESTVWARLPGCGHVPMSDDPELVASVILAGTE